MNNRDQFAAAALAGILAAKFGDASGPDIVAIAYEFADGMVRGQKSEPENNDIFKIACAVADEWSKYYNAAAMGVSVGIDDPALVTALNFLEEATRQHAMRKVRP